MISPARWSLLLILGFLVSVAAAVLLNVPVLRQLLGFLLLTFVPGLLLIQILKLNRLGLAERLVLTVGLSLTFLMFFGLTINFVYPALGYPTPLSTSSMIISVSGVLIILILVACFRNRTFPFNLAEFHLGTREKAFLLLPSLFPLISFLGMRLMNTADNNVVLMVLLFLIAAYIVFTAIYHSRITSRTYPILLLFISLSLLLMLPLRSGHFIADLDTAYEYQFFRLTAEYQRWSYLGGEGAATNAVLGVTLLPAIYHSILGIELEPLYKLLFPVLILISPIAVYSICRRYIDDFHSFLASLFFMSQTTYLYVQVSSRTNMAILFFALAVMVLFHRGIDSFNKKLLFIVFAASIIVSHYSTGFAFFFMLLLTWIGVRVILQVIRRWKSPAPPTVSTAPLAHTQPVVEISILGVALVFTLIFLWYSQATGSAFVQGVRYFAATLTKLQGLFLFELRRVSGLTTSPGAEIPATINQVVAWLGVLFIIIGVLVTMVRRNRMLDFAGMPRKEPDLVQTKLNIEYFTLSVVCCLLLAIFMILPYMSSSYSAERLYSQTMVVLSLFFVLGGMAVARFSRVKPCWVIVAVLVPYLLSTTGAVYQVFGDPRMITLNARGIQYDLQYIRGQEVSSIAWLSENTTRDREAYFVDYSGEARLLTYGGIWKASTVNLVSALEKGQDINGFIYLRHYNVVDGKLALSWTENDIAIEKFADQLAIKDIIYDNGESEVLK